MIFFGKQVGLIAKEHAHDEIVRVLESTEQLFQRLEANRFGQVGGNSQFPASGSIALAARRGQHYDCGVRKSGVSLDQLG